MTSMLLRLLLAVCSAVALAMAQDDAGGDNDPGDDGGDAVEPVVGELTVRFSGSGEGSRTHAFDGWAEKEQIQVSIQAEGRYEMVLRSDGLLGVGNRLDGSVSASVGGV